MIVRSGVTVFELTLRSWSIKKQSFSELLYGSPKFVQTSVCYPHDIVHTAFTAVSSVKPWEYELTYTKAHQLPHTLRTVAHSQSVCVANNDLLIWCHCFRAHLINCSHKAKNHITFLVHPQGLEPWTH